MKRQNSKGSKKQSVIARAASKLFNRKGYLETSMDDIAALAKVSKGSLYYYFSTKEEILFFILDTYMAQALGNLDSELEKTEEAVSRLRSFISRHVELYVNNLDEAKTLLHEGYCLSKNRREHIAEKERKYSRIVSELIRDLFKGATRPSKDEITVMTFLLFGMCNWIYSWYSPKGPVTPENLSQMVWRIYMEGVKGLIDKKK